MKAPKATRDDMSPYERRIHLATKATLRTNETAEVLAMAGHEVGGAVIRRQIDAGAFPGRRIPGSKFRVTDRAKLDAWMRERDIDASAVTPKVLVLAEPNGGKEAFADVGGGRIECYDTFTLAQLILKHPVLRIVFEQTRGDVAEIMRAVTKACESRRYPVPAMEVRLAPLAAATA